LGKNVPAVWKSLFAKFSKEDPVRATGMPVEGSAPDFTKPRFGQERKRMQGRRPHPNN